MYTPYVNPRFIKLRLQNVVNFGDGGKNSFSSLAGGQFITDEDLNHYQKQGEQYALEFLSTLYQIPLEHNVTGGKTLDDFSDRTSGNLECLFISATCLKIIRYTSVLQGASKMMEISHYEKEIQEQIDLAIKKDQAYGVIIPAFEDLKLSNYYLTRQQNPIPNVLGANTKYTPIASRITNMNSSECGLLSGAQNGNRR